MRVTRLLTTAIKGLALDEPEQVRLTDSGAVGDRDFFCVNDAGTLVSITRTGSLCGVTATQDGAHLVVRAPDGTVAEGRVVPGAEIPVEHFGLPMPGRLVDGPWNALLSELAGMPLRLLRATGPCSGSDVHPVTLLGDDSVAAVAESAGVGSLDARRFRMLLGFDGAPPFEEDAWAGRRLRVGEAVLAIGGPVPRCAATLRDPDTGVSDVPVLKAIVDLRGVQPSELGDRGANLGVYARVVTSGVVRVGDALELL